MKADLVMKSWEAWSVWLNCPWERLKITSDENIRWVRSDEENFHKLIHDTHKCHISSVSCLTLTLLITLSCCTLFSAVVQCHQLFVSLCSISNIHTTVVNKNVHELLPECEWMLNLLLPSCLLLFVNSCWSKDWCGTYTLSMATAYSMLLRCCLFCYCSDG